MKKDLITIRAKEEAGVKKDSELADLLGISAGDFSNRKRIGTHETLIIVWAAKNGYNVNYILHGDKETRSPPDRGHSHIREEHLQLIDDYDASSQESQRIAKRILEESAKESRGKEQKERTGGGSSLAGQKSA